LEARGLSKSEIFAADFDPSNLAVNNSLINDAVVFGRNARLDQVVIDVTHATLWADAPGQSFTLVPSVDPLARLPEAVIDGSTMIASNGARMTLTGVAGALGKFRLFDTEVVAMNAGSVVELNGVALNGGLLKNLDGGVIALNQSNEFTNVNSEANLTVAANQSLTVRKIFRQGYPEPVLVPPAPPKLIKHALGTLNVEGTLVLDGMEPIGGGIDGVPAVQSGADVIGGKLNIMPMGKVEVDGIAEILGAEVANNGTINLDEFDDLTILESPDSLTPAPSFTNEGKVRLTQGAVLTVENDMMTNSGDVELDGASFIFMNNPMPGQGTYEQMVMAAKTAIRGNAEIDGHFNLTGGLLTGDGNVIGKLTQTGGMFEPGNSPGTFHTDGYSLTGGTLNIQVESKTSFDRVDAVGGMVELMLGGIGGKITLDLSSIPNPASLLDPATGLVGFDVFDGDKDAAGNEVTRFQNMQNAGIVPNRLRYHSFDQVTGTIYLGIPEPAAISLVIWAAAAIMCQSRCRR
jgi:hypothetical protein